MPGLRQFISDRTDPSPTASFGELSQAALERLAIELSELRPEHSKDRFEQAIKRFYDSVTSAEKTAQPLPLDLSESREHVDQMRRLFETQ